jgi:Ca-activated chloride channel family protein
MRTATAALAGLLSLGTAAPQAPPVFQVDLDMVHVTVTARDEKGQLVSDLERTDFVLREDGKERPVQLFAPAASDEGEPDEEELALNLGMLFDTSDSMRKELRLSQESAIRFLENIPRAKDLLLVFFDRDIRLSRYNSENQQGIFQRILETEGAGQTALYDTVAIYLSRVMDTPGRKVLVVFTDGDDTTSRIGSNDVVKLLRSSDVVVYPIAFRGERPHSAEALRAQSFLASLAQESGGQVFKPQASRELAAVYQSILDELGTQYVLGYLPASTARDGRYHRLQIEAKRPGLKLRYRPGYSLPKDEAVRSRPAK